MLVVGLTGGIATGKSTVSHSLASFGLPIIDADVIAREVVAPGTPGLRALVAHFGEGILTADGALDRPKLGAIIFNEESQRRVVNGIVHPAVWRAMFWAVVRCWAKGNRVCVLDVPLLVEGGMWKWVAKTVVVYCSPELQLQRLMKRDGSTKEAASARVKAQMPITEKTQYGDIVIDNSGSQQDLEIQVDSLVRRLYKEAGWTWRISWVFPPFTILSAGWTLLWNRVRKARQAARRRR